MGEKTKKNLLIVAGVVSGLIGIFLSIPAFMQEKYIMGMVATILLIIGLILIAIAFGD